MPNKTAYRTMTPMDGLSPVTDKSRGVPLFGNTPLIQDLINGTSEGYNDLKGRGSWSSEQEEDKSYKEEGGEFRLDESLRKMDKARATGRNKKRWVAELEDGSEYEFPSPEVARMELRLIGKPIKRLFMRNAAEKTDIVAAVAEGCVGIVSQAQDGGGVGAGFCVAPSLFVTCAHVVRQYQIGRLVDEGHFTSGATVTVSRGDLKAAAKVVLVDPEKDMALLSAELPSKVLPLSPSNEHEAGEDVVVMGSPKGYENTVSEGVISSLNRTVFTHAGAPRHVFTDAKILPGNSGGPMVAENDGTVVGLVEIVVGDDVPYGLNAAIASEHVIAMLKEYGATSGK